MTHEDRVTLLKQKRQYLCLARTAYEKANQIANDPGMTSEERDQINKEEWLHNYMLGKIAEKTNQKPIKVLEYYQNAMYFLHKEGAKYPEKIRYQNPSKYCLEALEVFYRAHVCVVKWLLAGRHSNLMTKFTERIQIFRNSPLASRELANPHDSLRQVFSVFMIFNCFYMY